MKPPCARRGEAGGGRGQGRGTPRRPAHGRRGPCQGPEAPRAARVCAMKTSGLRFCRIPATGGWLPVWGEGDAVRVITTGEAPLTVGFCSRCPRASGAAARPTGRCCAPCPRVPRRSVWTPCTSPTSAAPSAKTVGEMPAEGGCASVRRPAPRRPRMRWLPRRGGCRVWACRRERPVHTDSRVCL